MIPDDLQTLAMASQAPEHARSDEVRRIADHLDQARSDDVDRITTILLDHAEPRPRPGETGPLHVSGYFDGEHLADLARAGPVFDRDYLRMMLEHEEGALRLSDTEVRTGHTPAIVALAATTSADLTSEISQMQDALAHLR